MKGSFSEDGEEPETVRSNLNHPARIPVDELLKDCLIRRTRHGGPGGQHRNKVETAIEVVHHPTGIIGFAAERRSQEANRKEAIDRLRLLLAIRIRCVHSSDVHPSEMWRKRCRQQKIACNEKHDDFPAMLSEALDAIDAKEYDLPRAAGALGCSSSQLIRFIGRVKDALDWVNAQRQSRGMHRLHT
ncbi:MAG: peptide chain release factor-like protein [Planctomycetaceae bacterium]|nr:peptide chain release factor-like protein [Planctomycetaceae bacterium]